MSGRKLFQLLASSGLVVGGLSLNAVHAASVPPSEQYINSPATVLMVDGTDNNSSVSIRFWLSTPSRAAFDFGFMDDSAYVSITNQSRTQGQHSFLGGDSVDFALRNFGSDGLFGTSDDMLYRISDSAGYARQRYFAPINPSHASDPGVTQAYFQDLSLNWDLNLNGQFDAHTLIEFATSKYDGMMPSTSAGPVYCPIPNEVPTPVPVPAALWLFGSGLIALAATVRRTRRA